MEKKENWYTNLVEDCRAIITETVFTSRWSLVEGYHNLGKRILEENENFKRRKIYGKEIVAGLTQSLGKSGSTIWRAVQFAEKYPDIQTLPEGKNISWNKIVTKYLPAELKEKPVILTICPSCGHQFKQSEAEKVTVSELPIDKPEKVE